MLDTYWNNISSVDSYYKTNMDFLKRDVRDYFFKQYPDIYSKVEDLPPAKYNYGAMFLTALYPVAVSLMVQLRIQCCSRRYILAITQLLRIQ